MSVKIKHLIKVVVKISCLTELWSLVGLKAGQRVVHQKY